MLKKKYGVVILNYKSANDAILAAKSVIDNAVDNNYIICIVEGGSCDSNENRILEQSNLINTHILYLRDNKGYSGGNNAGIRYLNEIYCIEYIVIMNPDVCIVEQATIEDTIRDIEKYNTVGGQPLVKTGTSKLPADRQINIRNICGKMECLMLSGFIFNRIMRSRYSRYIYRNEMPFRNNVEFYAPSGAFFIIKNDFFCKIGLFDERTFLYNEEVILGYKIYQNKTTMILSPGHVVEHECGKSIGANAKKPSKFSHNESKKSFNLYMKEYLKMNKFSRMSLLALKDMDFFMKRLFFYLR